MIKAIRIRNLRSLQDTGFIDLKKITVLLGVNSSGKSTFLRSFPLLSQSINKNLREPITWFDDSMVDFGDYQTALYKEAKPDEGIHFSFRMAPPYSFEKRMFRVGGHVVNVTLDGNYDVDITYGNEAKGTYVKEIQISHNDSVCKMLIDGKTDIVSFYVDDISVDTNHLIKAQWESGSMLIPLLSFLSERDNYVFQRNGFELIRELALDSLKKNADSKLKHTERLYPYMSYAGLTKEKLLHNIKNGDIQSIRAKAAKWDIDSPEFVEIYNYGRFY